MSDERRDPVIARALRDIAVPDHGEAFWTTLDERLARAEHLARGGAAPVPPPAVDAGDPGDTSGVDVLDTRDVLPLRRRAPVPPRHRDRGRVLVAAAVLAVAAAAAGVVLANRDGDQELDVAGGGDAPSTTADPAPTQASATAPGGGPTLLGTGQPTPDGAVLAFLDALGAGEVDAAAALTGPRSRAYIEALGGTLEGILTESQEGYGAWSASPDRTTTEVDLGDVDGTEVTIVVVLGTWTGEGETGYRTDALPAVRTGDRGWLVEPFAFDTGGGRLELVSPAPTDDGSGLNGLAPDEVIEVTAVGNGRFYFSLDDGEVAEVAGAAAGGGVQATWDPPGELRSGSHLLVVAYADGDTLTAFAGVFAVEG